MARSSDKPLTLREEISEIRDQVAAVKDDVTGLKVEQRWQRLILLALCGVLLLPKVGGPDLPQKATSAVIGASHSAQAAK